MIFRSLLTALLILISTPAWAGHCYIAQWEWVEEKSVIDGVQRTSFASWRAPFRSDLIGSYDLRGKNQKVQGGVPQGYGLFTYNTPKIIPGSIYLGDDLTTPVKNLKRKAIEVALGLSNVEGSTAGQVIYDLIFIKSSIDNDNYANPILPTKNRKLSFHLKGFGQIVDKQLRPGVDPEWDKAMTVWHKDYKNTSSNLEKCIGKCFIFGKRSIMLIILNLFQVTS